MSGPNKNKCYLLYRLPRLPLLFIGDLYYLPSNNQPRLQVALSLKQKGPLKGVNGNR